MTRYNKKTVTVITDDGEQWNVSPGFLRKAEKPEKAGAVDVNVVRLHKK